MDPESKFAKFTASLAAASVLAETVYALVPMINGTIVKDDVVTAGPVEADILKHIDNELPGLPDYTGARPLLETSTGSMSRVALGASTGSYGRWMADKTFLLS